jgi:hypothetical protein
MVLVEGELWARERIYIWGLVMSSDRKKAVVIGKSTPISISPRASAHSPVCIGRAPNGGSKALWDDGIGRGRGN